MKWTCAMALLFITTVARGQEDDAACQVSYVSGQKLYRLEHDLLRGREQLLVCAKTCPDQLRASCGTWLRDIEAQLPSIVIKAKDGQGRDVPDVSIDVDDAPARSYTEGLPLELNPGKHIVRVHRANKSVEQPVLVNAGEKLKVVEVWLEPPRIELVRVRRPVPVGAFVFLGVGAAALASFATFAIWTTTEFVATNSCAPACNPSVHDGSFDVKTAIADVSLAVSAAALVGAAIIWLTRPKVVERTRSAMWIGPGSIGWRF